MVYHRGWNRCAVNLVGGFTPRIRRIIVILRASAEMKLNDAIMTQEAKVLMLGMAMIAV
jgi:hypothetical protein